MELEKAVVLVGEFHTNVPVTCSNRGLSAELEDRNLASVRPDPCLVACAMTARATTTSRKGDGNSPPQTREDSAQTKVTDAHSLHQINTICPHWSHLGSPCHREALGCCVKKRQSDEQLFRLVKQLLTRPSVSACILGLPSAVPGGPYPGNNYRSSSRHYINSNNVAMASLQHP